MKSRIKRSFCIFFAVLTIVLSFSTIAQASVTTGSFVPYTAVGCVKGKCVENSQTKGGQTLYGSCLGGDLYDISGTKKTGKKYVMCDAYHSKVKCQNTYASMDTTDYITGNKVSSLSATKSSCFGWDMEVMVNDKMAAYTRKVSVFGCSESYCNGYSYVLYPSPINV